MLSSCCELDPNPKFSFPVSGTVFFFSSWKCVFQYSEPWFSCIQNHGFPVSGTMVFQYPEPWFSSIRNHGFPVSGTMVFQYPEPWFSSIRNRGFPLSRTVVFQYSQPYFPVCGPWFPVSGTVVSCIRNRVFQYAELWFSSIQNNGFPVSGTVVSSIRNCGFLISSTMVF